MALRKRIAHAVKKHPGPFTLMKRFDALRAEVEELDQEIYNDHNASFERIRDEALDVATVAMRIACQANGGHILGELALEDQHLTTVYENLRATQTRCNELLEENRRLKAAQPDPQGRVWLSWSPGHELRAVCFSEAAAERIGRAVEIHTQAQINDGDAF